MAFVLALTAMIATYFDEPTIARIMFPALPCYLLYRCFRSPANQIMNTALDVHLSDLNRTRWQQYLKPKRNGITSGKAAGKKTG